MLIHFKSHKILKIVLNILGVVLTLLTTKLALKFDTPFRHATLLAIIVKTCGASTNTSITEVDAQTRSSDAGYKLQGATKRTTDKKIIRSYCGAKGRLNVTTGASTDLLPGNY